VRRHTQKAAKGVTALLEYKRIAVYWLDSRDVTPPGMFRTIKKEAVNQWITEVDGSETDIDGALARLGKDGWELVSAVSIYSTIYQNPQNPYHLFFERLQD
jgi:hypothetical protein